MPLTLQSTPGFADVLDTSFIAEYPALGLNLARVSLNAAFGMVRPEIFYGLYKHGETVNLPQSAVDGYVYAREELSYIWAVQSSLSPSSGWITGPDSLWYAAWIVDQDTGAVESIEYYRRSGSHDNAAQSNDGTLGVFTIAHRQATTLLLAAPADSFTDIADGDFTTDTAFIQSMAQSLNDNARFAVLNSEIIYMGEFYNGQTVPQPVSPADSYTYAYSQVKFGFSWRWTTVNSAFTQPDKSLGQLGPMLASINASTGVVSITVKYIDDAGSLNSFTTHGRIAVFAFCSRNNIIGSLGATANAFAEIDFDVFMPGSTLRASTLLQLQKNIREAACSCEFFGPTTYNNGDTVPLPISPVDGYVYTRAEITPVWEWNDTTNQTGSNLRVAGLWAQVSQTTGAVTIRNWRLPPGGPYVESDSFSTINVVVVAQRGAQHSSITVPGGNPAGDSGSAVADNNPPDIQPYALPYFAGETAQPIGSELILKHVIPGDLASMTLPINLTGSYGGCVTAPTGAFTVTLKKGSTTIGTLSIASGATTATFTFAGAISFAPGDIINCFAPSSADSTMAGLYFTLSGTRT
jgi:hypothetical protein